MARRFRTTVLLAVSLALTLAACVSQPPPFTYDLDVLYFVDQVEGVDAAAAALAAFAATYPNLTVTTTAVRQNLIDGLATNPDLVIVFNQNTSMPDDFRDAVVNWIAGGGRAVVADWAWRTEVLDALEVTQVDANLASVTFDDTRLGVGVTSPMVLASPGWSTYATGLATTTGVVAASFNSGSAAVVYGNDGDTAAVGLLNDTITDANDGEDFFTNLFDLMMKGTAVP